MGTQRHTARMKTKHWGSDTCVGFAVSEGAESEAGAPMFRLDRSQTCISCRASQQTRPWTDESQPILALQGYQNSGDRENKKAESEAGALILHCWPEKVGQAP